MRRFIVAAFFVAACTKQPPATQAPAAQTDAQTQPSKPAAGDAGAPVSEISIDPSEPLTGQTLTAKVVDPLNRTIEFVWSVDGEEVSGEHTDRLEGQYVKKGTSITVRALPHSDAGDGKPLTSAPVKVQNSPPLLTSLDLVSSANNLVVMQARAEDPDGDTLKYRIVSGPPGMTIDGTGRLQWAAPATFASEVTFVVGTTDGSIEATMQGSMGQR